MMSQARTTSVTTQFLPLLDKNAVKARYVDKTDTSNTDGFTRFIRIPTIYKIKKAGSTTTAVKVAETANDRVDILWKAPFNVNPEPLKMPFIRKTYMCKCTKKTRKGGPVDVKPEKDIPDLSTNNDIKDCFEFKLAGCADTHTEEKFGGILIQKDGCPKQTNIKTLDVSFVALNEKGFPVGSLDTNKFVKPCLDSTIDPSKVKPVVNGLLPVSYKCDKYQDTEWLSIGADTKVASSNDKRVIQVMFNKKLQASGAAQIQMFAEVSVDLNAGGTGNPMIERYRILSDRRKLVFAADGTVDFGNSMPVPGNIDPSPQYLIEDKKIECDEPEESPEDPKDESKHFFCRNFENEVDPDPTNNIAQCVKTQFKYDQGSKEFFVIMEKGTSGTNPNCANYKIKQSLFMVMERSKDSTKVSGTWAIPDATADKAKCTASGTLLPSGFRTETCVVGGTNDEQLYHMFVDSGDKVVCGKWKYDTGAPSLIEVQAGVRIQYFDGTKDVTQFIRIPTIYKLTPPTPDVEEVQKTENDRVDILWKKPFTPNMPPVKIPFFRKTHMCKCFTPRRVDGVIHDPDLDIPELPNSNEADLSGCFEFKLATCPMSITNEKFGATFILKAACRKADLNLTDISFVALNENGFVYGELVVNILVRPCIPQNVLSYQPVIHELYPFEYKCDYPDDQTLYAKKPTWLSINANLQPDPAKSFIIQVMFKERIKDTLTPESIRIVAEFGAKIGKDPNIVESIHRMRTESVKLVFKSSGELDLSAWPFPTVNPIEPNPEYLEEKKKFECNTTDLPCQSSPCLAPSREYMLCRKMTADSKQVEADAQGCVKTLFNYDTATKTFYASVELKTSCAVDLVEMALIVLERTVSGISIVGKWDKVTSGDFVVGKCKDASSMAQSLQPSLKYSVAHCNAAAANDKQLYHSYKPIGNQMVCGKWTYDTKATPNIDIHEIQAGLKIHLKGAQNERVHIIHIPQIYEITMGASKIEKVVALPNNRTDILYDKKPDDPILKPPVPRRSHMCKCINPRRHGLPDLPTDYTIIDVPSVIKPCFDFKLSNCPQSHTGELLGAVFVLKSKTAQCPEKTKLVDISVIAINEKGYPYGRLEVNKQVKMCFDTGNPYPDVKSVNPVVNEMYPFQYDCKKFSQLNPETMYANPSWTSISADVSIIDRDHLFQFVLKDPVETSSGSFSHPKSLQFIAEFGVIAATDPNNYTIYRMRTDHRTLKFSNGKVDFGASTIESTDITLSDNYLDEKEDKCEDKPEPITEESPKDSFCGCEIECEKNKKCDKPADPTDNECFHVELNLQSTPTPVLYMSFRKDDSGPNCNDIHVLHVMFTMLKRTINSKKNEGEVVEKWDIVDDLTTAGTCIKVADPTLKPKPSSRYSVNSCSPPEQNKKKGAFWHHAQTPMTDSKEIICAHFEIEPKPSGTEAWDIQAGYKVIYKKGTGNDEYMFSQMQPEIFLTSTSTTELIYDNANKRVDILSFVEYTKETCAIPKLRRTHMCECFNPQTDGKDTYDGDITELDLPANADLAKCFEFKMVDCKESHTNELLGVAFIQKGEECNKAELKTHDLTIVAINEIGYPYGELEVTKTSGECLKKPAEILTYRPIVNEFHPKPHECKNLYKPERSKYDGKPVSFISMKLKLKTGDINSDPTKNPGPQIVQVMLKEVVKTGIHPTNLQFIAEFTVQETNGAAIKAYRIASKNMKLAFDSTNNKVDFSQCKEEVGIPRIELHPDYIEIPATDPDTCTKPSPTEPPSPDLSWTTCNCFKFEQATESSPADEALVKEVQDCLAVTLKHEFASATHTIFFSIGKLAAQSAICDDIIIHQFALTALGRDKTGYVTTLASDKRKWDTVVLTDYSTSNCFPAAGTYNPVKGSKGKRSVKKCANDVPPNIRPALYFFYRYLKEKGDVHCGKWVLSETLQFMEIQILYKVLFLKSNVRWRFTARHPIVVEIKDTVYTEISSGKWINHRMDLLHTENPLVNPDPDKCIITPFVPTSDICDCTPERHGGLPQHPNETIVVDLKKKQQTWVGCFKFEMVPCTRDGSKLDTIGALFIIQDACTIPNENVVEDVAFQVLNGNGFPFGEPKFREFTRTCFQPADLLQYEIRKMDFTNPHEGKCNTRTKEDGSDFLAEYQYGDVQPTWLQIKTDAEVKKLRKPWAFQIYLDIPKSKPTATHIQFIAEMVIYDKTTSPDKQIYRIKSPVYKIEYDGDVYKPKVTEDPSITEIERSDEYYETDDEEDKKCQAPNPPKYDKKSYDIQQCRCFTFTDGAPPEGEELNSTLQLYTDKFEKCVSFNWTIFEETDGDVPGLYFYLSVFSTTEAKDAVCGEFQVVGATLTPLKQRNNWGANDASKNEQVGLPMGNWVRTTWPAEGYVLPPGTEPKYGRGLHCNKVNYDQRFRRLPFDSNFYTRECYKGNDENIGDDQSLMLFIYPLMNQDDDANAFCGGLRIADDPISNVDRFEFQIIGYFFIEFKTDGKKYAMKRSPLFEFHKDAVAGSSGGITFPSDKVFIVQEASQDPKNCSVDICIYEK